MGRAVAGIVAFAVAGTIRSAPDPIYRTFVIETFEEQAASRVLWQVVKRGDGRPSGFAQVAGLEPTPGTGRRYLEVLVRGRPGSGAHVRPSRSLRIPGVVRAIRLQVYGFGRPDRLYMDLVTPSGSHMRLPVARLDFRGWRELVVAPPAGRQGRGERLVDGNDSLTLIGFYLRLSRGGSEATARLYLDDLRATVRDPYQAPPPDWN